MIPFYVKVHAVTHWKAPRYGKYDLRGLSYNGSSNICQNVMKSVNLLHKQDFDDSQSNSTVLLGCFTLNISNFQPKFEKYSDNIKMGARFTQ